MTNSPGGIMPVGPLMKEHRLIERMIALLVEETKSLESGAALNISFITQAADFIKTYADQCHHGKEEDILFRELGSKELAKEHAEIMSQLIAEHKYGRKTLQGLVAAKERFQKGDNQAAGDALNCLKALAEFYPRHIEKEDKRFFLPCMDYFSREEKDKMLLEFWDFDKTLIHKKYNQIVEQLERDKHV